MKIPLNIHLFIIGMKSINIGLGGLRLHLYFNTCFGIKILLLSLIFCCNLDPNYFLPVFSQKILKHIYLFCTRSF